MKPSNLILAVLAVVALLLVVKRNAVAPAPQTEPSAPVTGRTVARPAAETPTTPAAPESAEVGSPAAATPAPAAGGAVAAGTAPTPTVPRSHQAAAAGTVVVMSSEPALVPGAKVSASLTVRGRRTDLTPNQVGSFPRVYVEPGEKISVVAQWPEAAKGQRVVAAAEDGGTLNDGRKVLALDLDAGRRAAFEFTAGLGRGIYRVTLRQGPDVKTLELWAGPELALEKSE